MSSEEYYEMIYWEYYYEDYDGPFTIDYELFTQIVTIISDMDTVLLIIGLIANLLHLIVLTCREMRKQFFYVLMLGICLYDITLISVQLIALINDNTFPSDKCLTSPSITYLIIDWLSMAIIDLSRRSTCWLALLMALFRMLTVIFPMSQGIQGFQKPKSAILMVFGIGLVCSAWDGTYWWRFTLTEVKDDLDCFGVPVNKSQRRFEYSYPHSVAEIQELYQAVDGFSHVVTSILYIIITTVLILKLVMIRRKSVQMSRQENNSTNTTKLVAVMAFLFFTSEFCFGAQTIIHSFLWLRNRDVQYVAMHVVFMTQTLITLNSTLHCFFCIFLSSQYRDTVKMMICGSKKKSVKTMITARSTKSTTSNKDKSF